MTVKPGPLNLRTLGTAALYADGATEPLLGAGKPLALLVYLAMSPGRRTSREFLLDLLWADVEPERARNALRQVLFHLRRLIGDDALPGSAELTLGDVLDSDRDRFLRAVESGDVEAAVELYDGEFLPSFGVPGGARFEQWADVERHRLRAAFLRSAELLVRRWLNESRFREAQRLARRARDEAPDSEASWRLVLETAIAARDFVSAVVEADALERWAAEEQVKVEPATRLAIARARQASPESDEPREGSALVAELTGREREFSAITAAWQGARTGHARHLHLIAPAGIGKTRLLRDAVARLRAAGAAVVELRGAPGDRDIPYAFASDLAMSLAALRGAAGIAPASASVLIALNPALSSVLSGAPDTGVGEDALRRRVYAIAELVSAVADEQPFVLAIDDMHWLDPQSYRVLEGLFGRLNGAHVLCLSASRPERKPSGDNVTQLPLAPLTASQVSSLIAALGVMPSDEVWNTFAGRLHKATHGSPLLILETLRLAMDQGILALENGAWQCLDEERLRSLLRAGEALRHRVRALPDEHAWVLALLATVGTPVTPEQLAEALSRPLSTLRDALGTLERQGLAAHAGLAWVPAHDEIAVAARDVLDEARQAEAERVIGELLVRGAGADASQLLRGARHLVAAGDSDRVRGIFRRYARLSRERRDRRPFPELAAELLGEDVSSPRTAVLVRSLPRLWRAHLWNRLRQGLAAAAMIVMMLGTGGAVYLHGAHAASVQRLVYADSARVTMATDVSPSEWDGRETPVTLTRSDSPLATAAWDFPERHPVMSPDGQSVAWNRKSGDSTTIDIWIRTPSGTRRLTMHARDDVVTGWLPDGSALVGLTNRWSPLIGGDYDVAIYDTATGTARQITHGRDHDGTALPSPDGTRIAFLRESHDLPPRLCITTIDGSAIPECRLIAAHAAMEFAGWTSNSELLVTIDSAGARPLVRYDWQQNETTRIAGPYVYGPTLSVDRQWVVASLHIEGIRGFRDWVIPVNRPAQARQVEGGRDARELVRWWEGPSATSEVIDRIEFSDTTRMILPGIGTRLGVRALTAAGVEVPLYAPVSWRSSDTLVATVDHSGEVNPRSGGRVTITATLAGWRAVSREVEVRSVPVNVVLDERWDSSWQSRWIAFGDPAPRVTTGPGGVPAFWNRGDGRYFSTAVQRRSFSARNGLGVEVQLSTPVTGFEWQRLRVSLAAGIDTAVYRTADQAKAAPSIGRNDARCGISYPGGVGRYGEGRLSVNGATSATLDVEALRPLLASGAWWTLRVQILPDGRCSIAVNGKVVWLAPEPMPIDGEFRLRLGDDAAGTKLLHGPLREWTGVRTDIDWSGPAH